MEKVGRGRERKKTKGEWRDGMEEEGRDFGPPQCWKQIDATEIG